MDQTKIIVGLGNPGENYAATRHNFGFMVVERLAHDLGAKFKPATKLKGEVAETRLAGHKLILLKPHTFMNLSGEAVQAALRFWKLELDALLVAHDELDLPFGSLRVQVGGGTAGHKGVESIAASVGSDFGRFRLGIANEELRSQIDAHDFVLMNFTAAEREVLPTVIELATKTVTNSLEQGLAPADYAIKRPQGEA